jgi:NAD(P)-dependent dehydrogenase (short-subunit alcohol dehydrogenase family)
MAFESSVVIVTGAAGHLGRAVARHFAARGARLLLVDVDRMRLVDAHGEAHERLRLVGADLRDPLQAQTAVQQALPDWGRIDVLVNVAGGFHMGDAVHEADDAAWTRMHDLNLRTTLNMCRAAVPAMLADGRGGAVVNVGAYAALRGGARMAAYAAAKAAVQRLTEAMAAELRDHGVRANCVLPTILDTPDNRAAMPQADASRWVAPDALAEVIGFLASDAARAVTGAALPVVGRCEVG